MPSTQPNLEATNSPLSSYDPANAQQQAHISPASHTDSETLHNQHPDLVSHSNSETRHRHNTSSATTNATLAPSHLSNSATQALTDHKDDLTDTDAIDAASVYTSSSFDHSSIHSPIHWEEFTLFSDFPPPSTSHHKASHDQIDALNFTDLPRTATQTLPHVIPSSNTDTPMGIIHDLGYCAPAAAGLLFAALCLQGTLNTANGSTFYAAPLATFFQHFTLYYQTENETLTSFTARLKKLNHHQIQWLLAPIFRLMTYTLLTSAKRDSSDDFHLTDTDLDWPDAATLPILPSTIHTAIALLQRINTCALADLPKSWPIALHILHHQQPLHHSDLFALCRFLRIELAMTTEFIHTESMTDAQQAATLQLASYHKQHAQSFASLNTTALSIHVHNIATMTPEHGFASHFDVCKHDPLLRDNPFCQQLTTAIAYPLDEIRTMATIAHTDPQLLLGILDAQASFLGDRIPNYIPPYQNTGTELDLLIDDWTAAINAQRPRTSTTKRNATYRKPAADNPHCLFTPSIENLAHKRPTKRQNKRQHSELADNVNGADLDTTGTEDARRPSPHTQARSA